nr:unnamed protein product [Digitaria exilis]
MAKSNSKKTKSTSKGPNQALNHLSPRLLAPPCLLAKAEEGGRGAVAPARGGRRKAPRSWTRGGGGAARPTAQPRGARPGEEAALLGLLLSLAELDQGRYSTCCSASPRGAQAGGAGKGMQGMGTRTERMMRLKREQLAMP